MKNDGCDVSQKPYWPNWLAGVALGVVLLLTFLVTGHGLGATGFTTRLSAWMGGWLAPQWTLANDYLGPMLDDGAPLSAWISWQGGVMAGLGARIAAGCTSGVGLSGAAVLSVAGFVFLGAFFAAGLIMSRLSGGGVR